MKTALIGGVSRSSSRWAPTSTMFRVRVPFGTRSGRCRRAGVFGNAKPAPLMRPPPGTPSFPALAGKLGVPGGGLINGAGFAFPKTPARLQRPDLVPKGTRTLNIVDVGAHLLDERLTPPIKAVFIYNHNPVVVHPDQNRLMRGLRREDLFVVGSDVAMTDSLAYADIVLPAASHFEHPELYAAYGQHWLQRAGAGISPQADALPNTEILDRKSVV